MQPASGKLTPVELQQCVFARGMERGDVAAGAHDGLQSAVESPVEIERSRGLPGRGAVSEDRVPGRGEACRARLCAQAIGALAGSADMARGGGDRPSFGQVAQKIRLPSRRPAVAAIAERDRRESGDAAAG